MGVDIIKWIETQAWSSSLKNVNAASMVFVILIYTSYVLEQLEFLESTCRTLIRVLSHDFDFPGNAVTQLFSDFLANILILRSHWQSCIL